jgi:hypothetical protein
MLLKIVVATGFAVATVAASTTARAAFVLEIAPDGAGNVDEIGSGSVDTAGLTIFRGTAGGGPVIISPVTAIAGPPVATIGDADSGFTGSELFGTGNGMTPVYANSGSGDFVGISPSAVIFLPDNYVSGSPLSDFSVFDNTSIAALQLTPGVYVYSFGSGVTADTFTVDITNTPVPEPAPLAALGLPLGVGLLLTRRREIAS